MERSSAGVGFQVVGLLVLVGALAASMAFGVLWFAGATVEAVESTADLFDFGTPATVFETIQSPDGAYDLVVSEKNCGATCTWITRVEIIESGRSVDSGDGVLLLVIHGHPDELNLAPRWIDDRSLAIVLSASDRFDPKVQVVNPVLDETRFDVKYD